MDVLTFLAVCLVIYSTFSLLEWLVGKISVGNYKERFILITGCDSGFGHDAAVRFSKLGFQVFAGCLMDKSVDNIQTISHGLGRIYPFQLDVAKEDNIKHASQFIRKTLPNNKGLWAIINNAGVMTAVGPIEMLSRKHYEDCLSVNLYGVINVTREFLPLVQMERGRVVNTSSLNGRISPPGAAPYNISKFAVEAYSDCLRAEQYHFSVSIHLIEPGAYSTNIINITRMSKLFKSVFDQAPQHVKEKYGHGYVEKAILANKQVMNFICSNKNYPVTDAYVHAVTSIAPKVRYRVGLLCAVAVPLMTILPTKLTDAVLGISFIKPAVRFSRRRSRLGKQ